MPSSYTTSNKVLRLEVARDPRRLQALFFLPRIRSASKAGKSASPCFRPQLAEHRYMMPAMKHEPTAGALRASRAIQRDASLLKSLPELMDRGTGVPEVLAILEKEFRTCEYNEFHVSRFSPSQIDPIRSGTSSRPLRQLPEMVFGNIALKSWSWEAAHLLRVTER